MYDEEFTKERAWIVEEVMEHGGEYEDGVECGCCFDTYHLVRIPCIRTFLHLMLLLDSTEWSSVPICMYSAVRA